MKITDLFGSDASNVEFFESDSKRSSFAAQSALDSLSSTIFADLKIESVDESADSFLFEGRLCTICVFPFENRTAQLMMFWPRSSEVSLALGNSFMTELVSQTTNHGMAISGTPTLVSVPLMDAEQFRPIDPCASSTLRVSFFLNGKEICAVVYLALSSTLRLEEMT